MRRSRALAAALRGPAVSRRIAATDEPIVATLRDLREAAAVPPLSLAQGIVSWAPPASAVAAATAAAGAPATHAYGPGDGTAELVEALRRKLKAENGIGPTGGTCGSACAR